MKHRTGWSPDQDEDSETSDFEGAPTQPLGEVLVQLFTDARAYIKTETERQRLRVGMAGAAARDAALLASAALFLLFGTVVAFLVGAILTLSPWCGPVLATVIVIGVALVLALLLAFAAWKRIARTFRRIFPGAGE